MKYTPYVNDIVPEWMSIVFILLTVLPPLIKISQNALSTSSLLPAPYGSRPYWSRSVKVCLDRLSQIRDSTTNIHIKNIVENRLELSLAQESCRIAVRSAGIHSGYTNLLMMPVGLLFISIGSLLGSWWELLIYLGMSISIFYELRFFWFFSRSRYRRRILLAAMIDGHSKAAFEDPWRVINLYDIWRVGNTAERYNLNLKGVAENELISTAKVLQKEHQKQVRKSKGIFKSILFKLETKGYIGIQDNKTSTVLIERDDAIWESLEKCQS